jgi:hypothetical protein
VPVCVGLHMATILDDSMEPGFSGCLVRDSTIIQIDVKPCVWPGWDPVAAPVSHLRRCPNCICQNFPRVQRNVQIFCMKVCCEATDYAHFWLIERSSSKVVDLPLEVHDVKIGQAEAEETTTLQDREKRKGAVALTAYHIQVTLEVLLQVYGCSYTHADTIMSQPPPAMCQRAAGGKRSLRLETMSVHAPREPCFSSHDFVILPERTQKYDF